MTIDHTARRSPALNLLAAYVGAALVLAAWRITKGTGALSAIVAHAAVLTAIVVMQRQRPSHGWLRGWLPMLALPVLYAAIPATAVSVQMRDAGIQRADRALFGSDVAQTLAGALPVRWISEVLHAAYLSYYVIIYLPPLLMYLRRDVVGFDRMVLAFVLAMVGCFTVFSVFPVEGPRYAWPAPPEVPSGPVRSLVLEILSGGSSRGTAFPSSHLAIALVMSLSSMQWERRLGWLLLAVTTLLGIGAVYGGFHYATDVAAGALVGLGAWWAAKRLTQGAKGSPV